MLHQPNIVIICGPKSVYNKADRRTTEQFDDCLKEPAVYNGSTSDIKCVSSLYMTLNSGEERLTWANVSKHTLVVKLVGLTHMLNYRVPVNSV